MNKKNLNILIVSIGITIFGILIDGDVKEPSILMRFIEFFVMIGIVFVITYSITNIFYFTKNKINLLRNIQ